MKTHQLVIVALLTVGVFYGGIRSGREHQRWVDAKLSDAQIREVCDVARDEATVQTRDTEVRLERDIDRNFNIEEGHWAAWQGGATYTNSLGR